MTPNLEFNRLELELHDSWLVRRVESSAATWLAAAARSRTAATLRRSRERVLRAPGPTRLRAVTIGVVTSVAAHLALLAIVPTHIAPMLPKSFWVLIGVTALLVAFSADRVSTAWQSSRTKRLVFPGSRRSAQRLAP